MALKILQPRPFLNEIYQLPQNYFNKIERLKRARQVYSGSTDISIAPFII
jgi:hypothetical protein